MEGPRNRRPRREIPPERKAAYYVGLVLIVTGIGIFASSFFSGPDLPMGPKPGEPDFWERAQEKHRDFQKGMSESMTRALAGMGLMLIGGLAMFYGRAGAAGSGLVLDPEMARRDLEPWARMGGGMVKDALEEADLPAALGKRAPPPPAVKIRCRGCQALNDETAKFCSQCGAAV